MKRTLVILLTSLLCYPYAYAQISTAENSKFDLMVRGGLLSTDLYNPPFFLRLCFEGCSPEEQSSITTHTSNIGIAYQY